MRKNYNMQQNSLTVKQLNFYVKSLMESDSRLMGVCVTGEISNLKNHYSSGHIYFTLKDADAAIRCVMFRTFASRIKFDLKDGMQVVLKGRVSLYEKDGQYQFYAEEMFCAGLGDITLKFEQIKEKLEKEGLFATESKRPIPKFSKKIAVITSESGAAVQDIMNILSRRWPVAEILLCPVSVQGELAVPQMLTALERVYCKDDIDLIIIGRGGGSIEDLWAFNDENLARKIYESPIPVISAVGHETDFTICDFVADLRAPTPSAAAELAVPDKEEFISLLNNKVSHLKSLLQNKYNYSKTRLEGAALSYYLKNPKDAFINRRAEGIDRLYDKLYAAAQNKFKVSELMLTEKAAKLDALSPLKTLSRGFAAIKKDGKGVGFVKDINPQDIIEITFADGEADCKVETVRRKNNG